MDTENKKQIVSQDFPAKNNGSASDGNIDLDKMMRLPLSFAGYNKLILRDLNGNGSSPSFYLYTRDRITEFLKNPSSNEKNIRDSVIYIYGASSHFRRLIQYFSSLSDLSYIVSPHKIDTSTAKPKSIRSNYHKTLNLLSSMDIKNQFSKVLTVCLREDVFYGTMWVTNESIIIQQLPPDYCTVAVVEDNVLNVSFDFSYFDSNSGLLPNYPPEFQTKYNLYQNDRTGMKWQELDSPTSFAVKCNNDILNYAIPPFAGLLREVYDIEDYKQLRMTRTELENYAMLVMKLGINADGEWEMDFDKAKEFWRNLDGVLPEQIGSVLSPMPIEKISFEKNGTGETNTVADAEQDLFSAAGVSSLLFNNAKASANALMLSIKADQAMTFGIVKSIEGVINRFVKAQSYGKNFKVTFLDCSPFNRKEVGDAYLKACQYGFPMVSYYCASQGLAQDEMDCMNFLEDSVLGIKGKFIPLQSSSTRSANETNTGSDGGPGRTPKEEDELTEEGLRTKEEA